MSLSEGEFVMLKMWVIKKLVKIMIKKIAVIKIKMYTRISNVLDFNICWYFRFELKECKLPLQ